MDPVFSENVCIFCFICVGPATQLTVISLIAIARARNCGKWFLEKICQQMHMFVHKVNGGEMFVFYTFM